MKLWWITDSARLASERLAVVKLAEEHWFRSERWLADDLGRIAIDGVIIARGKEYIVRLTYPDQFPSVPAWVQPRDPDARWSSHQYGKGGALCLELRPDNWDTSASGADVLRSAFHLLEKENPLGEGDQGEVASAHSVSEIQSYKGDGFPVMLGAGCLKRIRDGTATELKAFRSEVLDEFWPIFISDAEDRRSPRQPPTEKIGTWGISLPVIVVHAEPPGDGAISFNDLRAALGDVGDFDVPLLLLVLCTKHDIAYHVWGVEDIQAYPRRILALEEHFGVRTGRKADLSKKSVAIVGAGSVGSKIAETLVRTGVGKVLLVDGDIMLPGNLERHSLDWRDVAFLKVNGLRRRLLAIAPGADIRVITANLNWQRSAKTHANDVDKIASCDLIIDATGEAGSSLFLGAVATENMRPYVSAVVFEGGLGALIARSIPGRDASYVKGLAAYNSYCDLQGIAPPTSGRKQYEYINDAGEPVAADDAAVSITAGYAARIVLDILEATSLDKEAWLLLGYNKGWVFERQGHSIALDVGADKAVIGHDPAALEFARGLVEEMRNANPAS